MDQVEGEAGHPQPLEPGPTQVSHEKPAAIARPRTRRTAPGRYSNPPPSGQAANGLAAAPATISPRPVACARPETPASFCPDDVRKTRAEKTPTRNSTNLEGANQDTK